MLLAEVLRQLEQLPPLPGYDLYVCHPDTFKELLDKLHVQAADPDRRNPFRECRVTGVTVKSSPWVPLGKFYPVPSVKFGLVLPREINSPTTDTGPLSGPPPGE